MEPRILQIGSLNKSNYTARSFWSSPVIRRTLPKPPDISLEVPGDSKCIMGRRLEYKQPIANNPHTSHSCNCRTIVSQLCIFDRLASRVPAPSPPEFLPAALRMPSNFLALSTKILYKPFDGMGTARGM